MVAPVFLFVRPQSNVTSGSDELFKDLDGRELLVDDRTWRVEVFSIGDFDNGRWVQLGLTGDESFMVTLHCAPFEGSERLISAVRSWLSSPSETSQVLNVA